MVGMVKKLTKDRGFGFIRAEDGVDYFFHNSELGGGLTPEQVREGLRVTFEPRQTDKGPRAIDVKAA